MCKRYHDSIEIYHTILVYLSPFTAKKGIVIVINIYHTAVYCWRIHYLHSRPSASSTTSHLTRNTEVLLLRNLGTSEPFLPLFQSHWLLCSFLPIPLQEVLIENRRQTYGNKASRRQHFYSKAELAIFKRAWHWDVAPREPLESLASAPSTADDKEDYRRWTWEG